MFFGIIGALDKEVDLIRQSMTVESSFSLYGSTCYQGKYSNHDVAVVCCSIGKINAALCASTLIRELGIDVLVNVGIAGAIDKRLHILDVVLSKEVVFHDADMELYARYHPFQKSFAASDQLISACLDVLEEDKERSFSYHVGTVATGDDFINSAEQKQAVIDRAAPLCVEMEGAAIGQTAYMNGVPFLVIRTMSDSADDEAKRSYDNFMDLAADQSSRLVLRMMEQIA